MHMKHYKMGPEYTEIAELFDTLNEIDRADIFGVFARRLAQMGLEITIPLEITMEDVKFIIMTFVLMSRPEEGRPIED